MTTYYIILATTLVSLISLLGVIVLVFNHKFMQTIILYLVSFAAGAMLANVFFHLLPEAYETSANIEYTSMLVLIGMLGSFVLERVIHWHHCHNLDCSHVEPVGIMVLVGDALHNITDGILIASAFLVSVPVGIATTIAIAFHEVPQEISDFAVLIHSGFSKAKALLWNLASALTAFIGVGLVLVASAYLEHIELLLLPLIAGNFLYIAASDLLPTLHKHTKTQNNVAQILTLFLGIVVIYTLSAGNHSHAGIDDHDHDDHGEEVHIEHNDGLLEIHQGALDNVVDESDEHDDH